MNWLKKLARRIGRWYRRLFIEVPEGYGDTVSMQVEEFQEELSEKKETQVPADDTKSHHHAR